VAGAAAPVTRIRPGAPVWAIPWREMWSYRDLFAILIRRDLTVVYKQSILGPLWFVLQPLLTTVVFTVVFGRLAKMSTDQVPPFLFYMSGTVLWNFFAGCLNSVAVSLATNAYLFSKVYFPRLLLPAALVATQFVHLLLNVVIFAGVSAFSMWRGAPVRPTAELAWLPLLALQCGVVGMGVGLGLASLTVKYRDMRLALPFLSQLWMFATPVVYPVSLVSGGPWWNVAILALNPMAGPVDRFRSMCLGTAPMSGALYAAGLAVGLVVFAVGLLLFNKVQRTFVDTI